MGERVAVRRQIGRKGSGARIWVVIGGDGQREEMEVGKQMIMRQTGLAARDLRILDPMLSYPSAIMGRERAMVINLEHVKAIITSQQVLLLNSRDPSVIPFVDDLHGRIQNHVTQQFLPHSQGDSEAEIKQDSSNSSMKILPFEFVALEACIESVCSALENETTILEKEANNALDKLTSKISTLNLERVRHIKSRLVALTARAQKVRDELENLLDDDEDMAELFLTDKLADQHHHPTSSVSSFNSGDVDVDNLPVLHTNDHEGEHNAGGEHEQNASDYSSGQIFGAGSEIHESPAGNTRSGTVISNKNRNVEDLEILLGAYFVQIGGTVSKLSALREYVDDTEDYININLDDKQNRILETGVKVGTASVLVNAFIVVTAIFGMNIHIELYDKGTPQFLTTTFGCTAACVFLYMVSMAWYKHKRLLE